MKKLFAGVLSAAVVFSLSPGSSPAQSICPAEVSQAKDMLSKARKAAAVKPEDVEVPRAMAGARENQNVQSPRGNQNVQSPRENENVQSPRGNQDVQAPRAARPTRADITKAGSLLKQAESACKAGNTALATEKAKAAMALLNP